ncbi:hypothetical protein RHGRI_018631 [Rhododendron griersonianum]|uniref:Uncharacterized protein n=1 Tax=Rhododendron griersonianum TaxID=479676 RepID=A0AAV6K2A9_9ERIC|nr:hypothetical protein RHGRI_018631 [Rhododendron griersonianum]
MLKRRKGLEEVCGDLVLLVDLEFDSVQVPYLSLLFLVCGCWNEKKGWKSFVAIWCFWSISVGFTECICSIWLVGFVGVDSSRGTISVATLLGLWLLEREEGLEEFCGDLVLWSISVGFTEEEETGDFPPKYRSVEVKGGYSYIEANKMSHFGDGSRPDGNGKRFPSIKSEGLSNEVFLERLNC